MYSTIRDYALAVNKPKKITRGKNKGRYKYELQHKTIHGTWADVEKYLAENNYILVGYDY
jgi:hypothetical protein